MEFRLFTVEDREAGVLVFSERPPVPEEIAVTEITCVMKSPIKQSYAQEAERLCWVADPLAGTVRDQSLIGAARSVAFLERWTLPVPLSMEGFADLAPPVAEAVHSQIMKRVYPSPATHPFGIRCWSKPQDGSEPGSAPETTAGETSTLR